jgi:hypothetical protein
MKYDIKTPDSAFQAGRGFLLRENQEHVYGKIHPVLPDNLK